MSKLLLRRLAQLIPTIFILSLIVFSLQHMLPGDPALVLAGEDTSVETLAEIRQQYGLDQPIWVQYFRWVGAVLQGDLGKSMRHQRPVLDLIVQKFPVTLQLSVMGIIIALVFGILGGVISAFKRDTTVDYAINVVSLAGISVPNFWLGILMILFFSIHLGWLPASGYVSLTKDWQKSLATTIMPAIVLGTAISGIIMRHTRSAMLQALESDYVRTARAKGLSETSVIFKHAMRNALTPIITIGALEFGALLAGAVLTEQIFTIPGFGKLIVDAVFTRDYPVVQSVVLVTALFYILLNLLADIGYMIANPKLRD